MKKVLHKLLLRDADTNARTVLMVTQASSIQGLSGSASAGRVKLADGTWLGLSHLHSSNTLQGLLWIARKIMTL
jgi:hypothetical protein